jgi:hypothetical protein
LVTNNRHWALKNDLMVRVLCEIPEYQAYRRALEERRKLGDRPNLCWPKYPESIEQKVDTHVNQLIRAVVDPKYEGTWVRA